MMIGKLKELNNTDSLCDIVKSFVFIIIIKIIIAVSGDSVNVVVAFIENSSDIMQVWATIIGFLMAAMAILLTVKDTKFIVALKNTGKFTPLITTFSSVCEIGSVIIVAILVLKVINCSCDAVWLILMLCNIFAFFRLLTCFKIFRKLIKHADDNKHK